MPQQGDRLRFDLSGGGSRRPRLSWLALGLVALIAFGLAGAVTVARVADREPVLALAQDVERGEPLTSAHLIEVRVGSDDGVRLVDASQRGELIGLVATSRLEAGTLLGPGMFRDGPSIQPGESVVGLALGPGEYPTSSLRPGDRVVVVRTPEPLGPAGQDAEGPAVLVDPAEVWAVEPLSDTARTMMVSIVVPDDRAAEVSAAAAAGLVRLVLVAPS